MRRMSVVESKRRGSGRNNGSIISTFLALCALAVTLMVLAPACSKGNKETQNRNNSGVVITLENADSVQLLETLYDHSDKIWTVAFSPNGKLLASCGQDGKVLVRSVDSLAAAGQMGDFPYWVIGLTFSPDGRYIAYGGAQGFSGPVGPIGIWNVEADSLERVLDGHKGGCWSLDYQESSGILVSGSFDGTVKMWNPQTGALLQTLIGHTAPVLSVDFNPHQDLIASSGIDYTVRLWDSQAGNPVSVLRGHSGNIGYVKFSPDGLKVASSADDGTVKLWNIADSSLIWSCDAGQG